MKRKLFLIAVFMLILTALTFAGCDRGGPGDTPGPGPNPQPSVVSVSAKQSSVTINEGEISNFDFTSLFTITVNSENVLVQDAYLDLSHLPTSTEEDGYVTCSYEGEHETVTVILHRILYDVLLSVDEVTINQLQYDDGYDFLSLFDATTDGESVEITSDMVQSDLSREAGDHFVTVTHGNASKTLIVHILEAHRIEIINSYTLLEIPSDELNEFDFTQLFSVYLDGENVKVTADMLDVSALSDAVEGETYDVFVSYAYLDAEERSAAKIKVVSQKEIVITAKNIVTYPNGEFIDLTSLFTIKKGDESIPVTMDMIEGSIDYSSLGNNEIVLTYDGERKTANVEVKRGVVINMPKGDTIIVRKGTNKNEYSFANDVSVIINGLKFPFVDSYIDAAEVDFDTAGTYAVTVSIPYNTQNIGITAPPQFVYENATINYVVVDNTYQITLGAEEVVLAKGTTAYNPLKNISVKINGKKKVLVEDKDLVALDSSAVWVRILSDPIDFDSVARQFVEIEVYADGVDNEPVTVTFSVMLDSDVKVQAINKVVFCGKTLYTKDLFSVIDNGVEVSVTNDMIEGKVDTFTPGIYTITAHYLGIDAVARVVVLSDDVIGVYHTETTTISQNTQYGEDEGDYGFEAEPVKYYGDMIISSDGYITVNGTRATIVDGVDENTLIINLGTNEHTVYFKDGIAMIVPDNELRMSFHDGKRPLAYFSEELWEIDKKVTINYSSSYVLELSYITYSIDTFRIKNKESGEYEWFAVKTHLINKTSSDTVYNVTWGSASYADGFETQTGVSSTLTFDGADYNFVLSDRKTGKIEQSVAQLKYANKVFYGTVDGKTAQLSVDSAEKFSLLVNGVSIFNLSSYQYGSMVNGGLDYANDIAFFYEYDEEYFSYKFKLDVENNTFELLEKDSLWGLYLADGRYIYLDGYGTGIVKFDVSGYTVSQIAYNRKSSEVTLRYVNKPYGFAYGDYATLYIDMFGNVLTAKYIEGGQFGGVNFVNSQIKDGAVVNILKNRFGKASDTVGKAQFYSAIEIVTKDGAMDETAKKACISTKTVKFGVAGFYQYTITVELGGESITAYYAVQILEELYSGNPLVATYGKGALNENFSLSIDKYGQITLLCGDVYEGLVSMTDDALSAKVTNQNGATISLSGVKIADGIIQVRGSGAVSFSDYFTTGQVSSIGIAGLILRRFAVADTETYILSQSVLSTGNIVEVELLEGSGVTSVGSVLKIISGEQETIVKTVSWGNVQSGLQRSDNYRGTYTRADGGDLVLDGFGAAQKDGEKGTYTINSNGSVSVSVGTEYFVYDVDLASHTYKDSSVCLDETLVVGKTFSAKYIFVCENGGNYPFSATTSFVFGENGRVKAISTSTEHDDGTDSCGYDVYSPTFASKTGMVGTYSVSANKITVSVGGEVFVFVISDVSAPSKIICESTSVTSNAHGYFAAGTIFAV